MICRGTVIRVSDDLSGSVTIGYRISIIFFLTKMGDGSPPCTQNQPPAETACRDITGDYYSKRLKIILIESIKVLIESKGIQEFMKIPKEYKKIYVESKRSEKN